MTPDQTRAVEYLRRKGTEAPVADIREKVAETFRELDELVAGRWCGPGLGRGGAACRRWWTT